MIPNEVTNLLPSKNFDSEGLLILKAMLSKTWQGKKEVRAIANK